MTDGRLFDVHRIRHLVTRLFEEIFYPITTYVESIYARNKRATEHRSILSFEYFPLISIVVPTYCSNLEWLQECVSSVQAQSYKNWELCISDDASNDTELSNFLNAIEARDKRIKLKFNFENRHICVNTNSAISLASGEYIALLDHDDLLAPNALFEIVKSLNIGGYADYLYTDEDKVNNRGKRYSPHYKGGFEMEKLYHSMFAGHLSVYAHRVIEKLGGMREGFEGAQDWDLLLRASELPTFTTRYIPRVLYHWRAHPDSTASHAAAKTYAHDASESALRAHFERTEQNRRLLWKSGEGHYKWSSAE